MSKVVFTDSRGSAIVARLNWSVFNGSTKSRSQIRESAGRHGAKRYVLVKDGDTLRIGLETDDVTAAAPNNAKRRHAFALLCREYMKSCESDMGTENAIFVLRAANEAETDDKRVICVIRNGEIAMDVVEQADRVMSIAVDAYNGMAGYCLVFSDSDDIPLAQVNGVEWDDLAEMSGKATALTQVPMSPMVPIGIVAAIAMIGGGVAYYNVVHIPKKQAERAKRAAEADKTPQYLKALNQAASSVGWDREALVDEINNLSSRTYFHAGWALKEIVCDSSKCTETWLREGGFLSALLEHHPQSKLVPDARMRADEVQLEREIKLKSGRVDLDHLPNEANDTQVLYKPVLQKLDNAGVRMTIARSKTWPNFDAKSIKKKSVIVKAQKIEVTSIYPFASDAISQLPSNVVFDGFTLKTSNPKSYILTVEGNGYVR